MSSNNCQTQDQAEQVPEQVQGLDELMKGDHSLVWNITVL